MPRLVLMLRVEGGVRGKLAPTVLLKQRAGRKERKKGRGESGKDLPTDLRSPAAGRKSEIQKRRVLGFLGV